MMSAHIPAVLAVALFVLAACRTSRDKGAGPALPPSPTTPPTGFAKPGETGGTQAIRAADIVARADLLTGSRIHGERVEVLPEPPPRDPKAGLPPYDDDPPEEPKPVLFHYALSPCSGVECKVKTTRGQFDQGSDESKAGPAGGVRDSYDINDMLWITRDSNAAFSLAPGTGPGQGGITVIEGRRGSEGTKHSPEMKSWGAWMDHSGFVVHTASTLLPGETGDTEFRTEWRHAMAIGEMTGYRPGSSLSWRGAMVGSPTDESLLLTGQAEIRYDPGKQELGAAFTDIRDAAADAPWGVPAVYFTNVRVDEQGRFGFAPRRQETVLPDSAKYIEGGFFGGDHVEVAGTFEALGILGAFGAKR